MKYYLIAWALSLIFVPLVVGLVYFVNHGPAAGIVVWLLGVVFVLLIGGIKFLIAAASGFPLRHTPIWAYIDFPWRKKKATEEEIFVATAVHPEDPK